MTLTLFENRVKARQLYEEVINKPDYGLLDSILSPDIVWHDPLLPGGEVRGIENFRQVLKEFRMAFPDLHITVEDQIIEGDKVVTRFTIHATHRGRLMGIGPTGKRITVTGISIIRFRDGKGVEEWIEEDNLGLMRQLGITG